MSQDIPPLEREDFYKLMPTEFERLVADVLAQSGYSDVKLVGGPGDQGVDILAYREGQSVAVQVKHKTRLTLQEINHFADWYFRNPSAPRTMIFVTSADLPPDAESQIKGIPPGARLEIVDRRGLQQMLYAHKAASQQVMAEADKRLKSQKARLLISAIAGLSSILGVLLSLYPHVFHEKPPLDRRIETVEKALGSMRDLEGYLADIKRDMEETQKATVTINQKYAEAKELEKLTAAQLAALQATLQVRDWKWTILNYVLGFVFGVASSLVASVLYSRWIQRRALA
jgi:Holliday junction resolvase